MRQNKHTGQQEIKEVVYLLLAAALCSSASKKSPAPLKTPASAATTFF